MSLDTQNLTPAPGPFEEFLSDVAALGVLPVQDGGTAYGMMRARSNERWWLLPIAQGGASSASIGMYQPTTTAARMARSWVKTALRLGITSGWASGRIHFNRLPRLPGATLPKMATCAYFTGTDGPHRKTAIQIMDRRGDILGYAKLGRRASVRPYMSHEASMLSRLSRLALSTASVPRLLAFEDQGGECPAVLVTDSRKTAGIASPMDPGAEHLSFLREMAGRTSATGASSAYFDLMDMTADPLVPSGWRRRFGLGLQRLAPLVSIMPVALAHGDFTPWNSFILKDRLYVFDWEYAADGWPVGYDLAHYILSARGAADPASTAERLIGQVAEAFAMEPGIASSSVLMSLLLHARFYLQRAIGFSADPADWTDGEMRGRVIDALLARMEAHGC